MIHLQVIFLKISRRTLVTLVVSLAAFLDGTDHGSVSLSLPWFEEYIKIIDVGE